MRTDTTTPREVTVNADYPGGGIYVIPCGNGYTCLGFEVAYKQAVNVSAWCDCPPPSPTNVGTLDGYRDYQCIMATGAEYAARTGKRCDAELYRPFVGKEGARVKVTDKDGRVRRFYIGKSAGWLPIHLEISRRGSHGGVAVYIAPTDTVVFTGTWL